MAKHPDAINEALPDDIYSLIHELNVHQVELEIQNEELRRSQAVIEESQHKYSDLYDFSPVGYLTTDKDGLIKQANLTLSALLLQDRSTFIGKPLHSFVAPQDQDVYYLHRKDVLESRVQQTCELWIKRADDTRFCGRMESVIKIDEHSDETQILSVVTDITNLKKAEEDLLRYASIASSSSDMMAALDKNFIYLAANEAYLANCGMTADEVVGHTVSQVLGEEFFKTTIEPNAKRCLEGTRVQYESWFQFPSTGQRYMLATYSPHVGQDGQINGFVVNAKDITDRKQAQEQIENLAKFLSENPNPVLRIARDGTLLYANDASQSLLKEWNCQVGQPVAEHWHQWVSETFESGAEKRVETEHAGRIFSFAIAPVAEADYANLYGRDITESKQVEEALQESEERFNLAVKGSNDGFWDWPDANSEKEWWSPRWYELLGYEDGEIEATLSNFKSFLHPDDLDRTEEAVVSLFERRVPFDLEYRLRTKSGEYRWFRARAQALWDADGKPCRMSGSIRDITDRKQAQEQIENLAKFPSENPNPVLRIARDGTLLYANDASQSLLNEWNCQVEKTVPEHWRQWVSDAFESGSEKRVEAEHAGRTFSFAIAPVAEAGYANLYGRDITDRKQAEQERERLMKTVAAKNSELQEIIYIASHDLKTPLVNILGFSGELLKDLEQLKSLLGKDKQQKSEMTLIANLLNNDIPQEVNFISSGAHMLKGLIDGMLEVSRIGNAEYSIEPMNMNEITRQVVDSLDFSIRDRGASVTVEHLPDCLGDATRTSQLLGNLINNAIKYLDPGRKGVICITGRAEDGRTEYCVQDNGVGIEPRNQHKVFEIFHRLNPDGNIGGEGLGLTIAMRILDRMDGSIRLESEPGKGSKFFVSLPTA